MSAPVSEQPDLSPLCFHCGLLVPDGVQRQVVIAGEPRDMCCAGCEAVATAIVENGLTDFYTYRTQNTGKPQALIPEELRVYDNEQLQKSFVRQVAAQTDNKTAAGDYREASLILEGIVCAACVWLNERHVTQLQGVLDFRINYTTHRAILRWDNAQIHLSEVLSAIADIGYHAHPFDSGRLEALQKEEKSKSLRRIAIAGVGMMQVMMLALSLYLGDITGMDANTEKFLRWVSLLLTTPVVIFASSVFFISAWRDLKRKRLGMDIPVSIAILVAYLASVWATIMGTGEVYFDSVNMFTFFLLVGRFLEMQARHKAGQVAEALVRLLPDMATRLKGDQQEVIPANELSVKDRVLIKPGEIIPADGNVLEGMSSVNESLLTGESLPLAKSMGDCLIGGTVNVESPLVMEVRQQGEDTVLSAIVRLLDQAQAQKPDIARFADKIASHFVAILLLVAVAVFAYWAWQESPQTAFWITLSVLVVTCPCALSLATPVATTAAMGELTAKGVLTTRGHALETLASVDHVVFDKTGTLTDGRLTVQQYSLSGVLDESLALSLAASLERVSEHPVAKAIMALSAQQVPLSAVHVISGKGVQADYQGESYRIGNAGYVSEWVRREELSVPLDESGGTCVYLVSRKGLIAHFELQDRLRPEAFMAIQALKQQNIITSVLSGDRQAVVSAVVTELGIDSGYGELLPEEKLAKLTEWQQQSQTIAMVGDGVNDAPVLAKAQVSVAMGQGSQLAQASADMILLSENLQHLPQAVSIARNMQRVIKQNFSWAIGYNLVAVPLAAAGFVAPWMAAIGMSASSLVVVFNSLRLKK